ncbi:MAG: PQQ-binding-like beta-propeller repeat protein, partial [Acidobacteria bacterium]|nr:PQQ-binding-like beta-propeller repeat protein [Acidobacteriota bacterium]
MVLRRLIGLGAALTLAAPAFAQDRDPGEWPHYAADLSSTRYSPLDQIHAGNVDQLEIVWRWTSRNFGPRPDFNLRATPLMLDGVVYVTAGARRVAVAIDAATGETLWTYRLDEGKRGESAPRQTSGRGVAFWSDGETARVFLVTPAYRLVALDAETGRLIPGFGLDGMVDLRRNLGREVDLETAAIGSGSPPTVVGEVVVVGAALVSGSAPPSPENAPSPVRGYDARTGELLWTFHTIPREGEFGNDTWENDSWRTTGNTGVWAWMSADPELGLVYLPTEAPTGDYYGGHRPGDNLFSQSVVALDVATGERRWHYQTVHHPIWDYDLPTAPILLDLTVDGREIPALAQVTKQAFTFVLDRRTGEPVWPIEERPMPASTVPGEKTAPTQPFP